MALNKNKNHKLYYSIKEVAAEIGVNESTLRYWESEFPQINPKKGGNNVRQYTREDIEAVRTVHHLVKERGMTLAGARRFMKKYGGLLVEDSEQGILSGMHVCMEGKIPKKLDIDYDQYNREAIAQFESVI